MAELKLNDLRRYAVLNGTTIVFHDAAGREARIAPSGVAEIPGLAGAPRYGIGEVLAAAEQFELSGKTARRLSRAAMAELVSKAAPAAASHEKEE